MYTRQQMVGAITHQLSKQFNKKLSIKKIKQDENGKYPKINLAFFGQKNRAIGLTKID